jgi:hypothetical protein
VCVRVANARHRASEDLHVALLHIPIAVSNHRTEFDNGSDRRKGGRHQSCAIEFPASLIFVDQLDDIVDFFERRFDGVAEKSRVKPGTGERLDAGMNELLEPVGWAGSGISVGLRQELADFREDEALHLFNPLDRGPLEGEECLYVRGQFRPAEGAAKSGQCIQLAGQK